jgi:hypothetical protein
MFSRHLDTLGSGFGTKNALQINRMIVFLKDTEVAADDYGAITGGLTNGITVQQTTASGTVIDLTDDVPIKKSADWAAVAHNAERRAWGAGNVFMTALWTFAAPIVLEGDGRDAKSSPGSERLVVTLNDNLTGLLRHSFLVQGVVL